MSHLPPPRLPELQQVAPRNSVACKSAAEAEGAGYHKAENIREGEPLPAVGVAEKDVTVESRRRQTFLSTSLTLPRT